MKKTYRGSCHCGAVQFECELDLAGGHDPLQLQLLSQGAVLDGVCEGRRLRLSKGEDSLSDYQHVPAGKAEPFLHLTFCKHCGVRPFSKGGELAQFGGEFFAVNVACLDDATDAELASAPIHHADGRNDDWQKEAKETSYL